jgi:hypothetical protein
MTEKLPIFGCAGGSGRVVDRGRVTKYELFRKRIAPIAFGVAIVLIARDSCMKEQRTKAVFVLDYGSAAALVQHVQAEVWVNNEQLSVFERTALPGQSIGKTTFTGSLPANDGELRIDVDLSPGGRHHVVRTLHVEDGATVTVPLERDLVAPATGHSSSQ